VIEWPARAGDLLPLEALRIYLSDITETKRAEQLIQAHSAELQEFVRIPVKRIAFPLRCE